MYTFYIIWKINLKKLFGLLAFYSFTFVCFMEIFKWSINLTVLSLNIRSKDGNELEWWIEGPQYNLISEKFRGKYQ